MGSDLLVYITKGQYIIREFDKITKVIELKKDPTIIDWLLTINAKPNTEKAYLQGMQDFTEYTRKDPETLLTEAEEDIRSGKLMRLRRIKRDLIGFRKHLQDSGKAPLTIKGRVVGVKSFFETFDIEIPKLPRVGKAKTLEKNKEVPNKEDLQEILKVADPLEKAILLTGSSSGLGANEICNMKVGEFKKGYDQKTGITTLSLRREKVEFDFITFLSPEASTAIWDYLDYRSRTVDTNQTRKKSRLEKQKVYTDNDYLFICRQIPAEFLDKKDDKLRKLDTRALTKVYRRLAEKASKSTPCGDWGFIRSHNMRKYFNSALLNAGCDSFHVEFFMGHTLDDTRASYFRANTEKLRDIYAKYVPYLTVNKAAAYSEETLEALRAEVEKYKAETEAAKVERYEHQTAMERFEEMFTKEIAPYKARFEAIEKWEKLISDPEKLFAEHNRMMMVDPEYAWKFSPDNPANDPHYYDLSDDKEPADEKKDKKVNKKVSKKKNESKE